MKTLFLAALAAIFVSCSAPQPQPIEWLSWEEGERKCVTHEHNVLVYVYDPTCETCETFEKEVLNHPEISALIRENFVTIKLNADRKEDIITQDRVWKNVKDLSGIHYHELAKALTKSTDVFELPALAFLDKEMGLIAPVRGVIKVSKLEILLKYVGNDNFQNVAFETFADTVQTTIAK